MSGDIDKAARDLAFACRAASTEELAAHTLASFIRNYAALGRETALRDALAEIASLKSTARGDYWAGETAGHKQAHDAVSELLRRRR